VLIFIQIEEALKMLQRSLVSRFNRSCLLLIIACATTLMLSGCAQTIDKYTATGDYKSYQFLSSMGVYAQPKQQVAADLPDGWYRGKFGNDDSDIRTYYYPPDANSANASRFFAFHTTLYDKDQDLNENMINAQNYMHYQKHLLSQRCEDNDLKKLNETDHSLTYELVGRYCGTSEMFIPKTHSIVKAFNGKDGLYTIEYTYAQSNNQTDNESDFHQMATIVKNAKLVPNN